MTEAFTLNAEQHTKQLNTYIDNLEVHYIEQPIKVKYGKFNITVKANNEPSEYAIKRTNSKVNELQSLF